MAFRLAAILLSPPRVIFLRVNLCLPESGTYSPSSTSSTAILIGENDLLRVGVTREFIFYSLRVVFLLGAAGDPPPFVGEFMSDGDSLSLGIMILPALGGELRSMAVIGLSVTS